MPVSQEENNKAIVRRYFNEILNGDNPAAMRELIAPDCVFTIPTLPDPFYGPEGYQKLEDLLRTAFPDLLFKIEDEVAEGDTVVDRWSATGTSKGPFNGAPPNGKQFKIEGIGWYRLKDGKFVENRVNEDTVGLLTQIGALPAPNGPTPEENNAIAERFFKAEWNDGNFTVLEDLLTSDAVDHATISGDDETGAASFRKVVDLFRQGLPDIHLTIEDTIYTGDKVVHRWHMTGTHTGTLFGVPATGKAIRFTGTTIVRMVGGKIAERWANVDELGVLRQIGVVPPAPPQ